ncbi:MAG: hypothetical protein M0T84_07525 [Betaproteobacteria bacterium]|nr:hypothetical protein [Betaproteobacteria bacterium]
MGRDVPGGPSPSLGANVPLSAPSSGRLSRMAHAASLRALAAQGISFLALAFLLRFMPWPMPPHGAAWLDGLVAASLVFAWRLPFWWWVISLLFPPLVAAAAAWHVRSAWFGGLFLVSLLLYWSAWRGQIPLFLSSRRVCRLLKAQLPKDQALAFADLGSGLGGVLLGMARLVPDGAYTGVENAPLLYAASRLRLALQGARSCRVLRQSFWAHRLTDYDVVYAYLSPVPMKALWEKACAEMRPGTLFVSNSFAVPDAEWSLRVPILDWTGSVLYLYRIATRH